jgi:hypothetical protein
LRASRPATRRCSDAARVHWREASPGVGGDGLRADERLGSAIRRDRGEGLVVLLPQGVGPEREGPPRPPASRRRPRAGGCRYRSSAARFRCRGIRRSTTRAGKTRPVSAVPRSSVTSAVSCREENCRSTGPRSLSGTAM